MPKEMFPVVISPARVKVAKKKRIMVVIVKIVGIIVASLGLVTLISPITAKLWLKSWGVGNRPAIAVSINFLIGVLLLVSAGECTISWIPSFVGILSIIKALVLLAYGPKRLIMKASIWLERRITLVRFAGLTPIALGVMLVTAV